ncbi:MAG: AAA family ATPase [Desulfoferrobacter sp.]
MYEDFFHLTKEPFHITPDPEFLFLSPSHKAALGSIIYGIEKRKGFIAITGEVGVGKTTVVRAYLDTVDLTQEKEQKIVYIFNPNLSFNALLGTIFRELGLNPSGHDDFEMVNELHQNLIEEYKLGHKVVLIIDEAQNMPVETLEDLRMLSNLETSKDKLIQILLTGQPELESMLKRHELRQFRQRIAIYAKIYPLTVKESLDYIRYRLERVAAEHPPIFTKSALNLIVKKAGGIPRTINILCDNALITTFGYQKQKIDLKVVREVIADFQGKKKMFRVPLRSIYVVVLAALLVGFILALPNRNSILSGIHGWRSLNIDRSNSAKTIQNSITQKIPQPETSQPKNQIHLPGESQKSAIKPPPSAQNEAATPSISVSPTAQDLQANQDFDAEHGSLYYNLNYTAEPSSAGRGLSADRPETLIRIVKKGDTLSKLVAETYALNDEELTRASIHKNSRFHSLLNAVKEANPQIKNFDRIHVGDQLAFPPVMDRSVRAAD